MPVRVEIVTPDSKVLDLEAEEVRAPGFHGEFGVLPGHIPFLSVVRPGVVTVTVEGGERVFVVGRGVAEAGADHLWILTELFEPADGLDAAAAARELAEAERTMLETAADSREHRVAEHQAELARARLAATSA